MHNHDMFVCIMRMIYERPFKNAGELIFMPNALKP